MPFDTSIYQNLDTKLPERLSALLDPVNIQEKQNALADLAMQRQSNTLNLQNQQRTMARAPMLEQRADVEYAAQQEAAKQKKMQDLAQQAKRYAAENGGTDDAIKQASQMMIQGGMNPDNVTKTMNNLLAMPLTDRQKFLGMGMLTSEKLGERLVPELPKPVEWRELQTDKGIMQVNPATGQLRPLGVNPVKKSDEDTNWTVIQTENGYAQVNPKTGQIRQLGVSKPINPLVEAKMKEAELSRMQQKEQQSLSAQQVLDQAALLYQHPGRQMGTGASSFMSAIPGTDAKGFSANLATFKAQTFVPMVSALKGMGALSDAEGKKLSESVGALDPSMSEEEFARSLQSITKFLYEKGRAAGLNVSIPDFAVGQQTGATVQFGTRSGATTSGW